MSKHFPIEILLVEDKEDTRIATSLALRTRGFSVVSPSSAEGVRDAMRAMAGKFAVGIFDMWLHEPSPWGVTGAQLAVELREIYNAQNVQIVAWSGFQNFDYVTDAIRARAVAYLSKSGDDLPDLIRHVRVLSIQHLLQRALHDTNDSTRIIAYRAESQTNLVGRYARRVLSPALDRALGVPFALIFVVEDSIEDTWGSISGEFIRTGDTLGRVLLARPGIPMVWRSDDVTRVVVALGRRGSARLVLFMQQVPRDQGANIIAESVEPLAVLVSRFLPSALSDGLDEAFRVRTAQDFNAVCVASDLIALAQSGAQSALQIFRDDLDHALPDDSAGLRALSALSGNLRHGTEMLQDLVWETAGESLEQEKEEYEILCSAVVKDSLDRLSISAQNIDFSFSGDGTIRARGGDLAWSISTLLQWFVDRSLRTPERRCELRFHCEELGDRIEIRIEDESERAPDAVRHMLFEPGAVSITPLRQPGQEIAKNGYGDDLALYVARTVLNWRHRCDVRDLTTDRTDQRGHRFVLSFLK